METTSVSSDDSGDEPRQTHAKQPPRSETAEQLGKQLWGEARDDSWASNAENALLDYLARQPYPLALGSPTILCRATLCLVQTAVDATILQAAPSADLQAAMGNIQYESLGRELVPLAEGMMTTPELPDQVIMWAMLQRVEPPGGSKPPISGFDMNERHRTPERWFSTMATIGAWHD